MSVEKRDHKFMLHTGTVDSSGMRMWFTSTPRQYDAGIITFGHRITRDQIIPPNAKNFTTTALLTEKCTNTVRLHQFWQIFIIYSAFCLCPQLLPKDGIRLFANLLHTHEAGMITSILSKYLPVLLYFCL